MSDLVEYYRNILKRLEIEQEKSEKRFRQGALVSIIVATVLGCAVVLAMDWQLTKLENRLERLEALVGYPIGGRK